MPSPTPYTKQVVPMARGYGGSDFGWSRKVGKECMKRTRMDFFKFIDNCI